MADRSIDGNDGLHRDPEFIFCCPFAAIDVNKRVPSFPPQTVRDPIVAMICFCFFGATNVNKKVPSFPPPNGSFQQLSIAKNVHSRANLEQLVGDHTSLAREYI